MDLSHLSCLGSALLFALSLVLLMLVYRNRESFRIITRTYQKTGTLRSDFPQKVVFKYGKTDTCPDYIPPPKTKQFACRNVPAVCPTLLEEDYDFSAPDSDNVCQMDPNDPTTYWKIGTKKDDTQIPASRQKVAAVGSGLDCDQPRTRVSTTVKCTPTGSCPPPVADSDYNVPSDSLESCTF